MLTTLTRLELKSLGCCELWGRVGFRGNWDHQASPVSYDMSTSSGICHHNTDYRADTRITHWENNIQSVHCPAWIAVFIVPLSQIITAKWSDFWLSELTHARLGGVSPVSAQWSQSCPDDEQDRREDRTATRQSVWPTSRRNPSQVASTEVIACHLMSHLSPQRKYGGTKLWKIWLRLNQVNTSYPPGWNTIKTNKENKNNWMELVDRRWVVCIS